jgi:hypothetical protein
VAASTASASSAVLTCVPLMSARPSLARSVMGLHFAPRSAAAPSSSACRATHGPSPSRTSAMCASGARSPLAPTEPRLGSTGTMPALKTGQRVLDQLAAHAAVAAREVGDAQREGQAAHVASRCGPTPAAWLRTRLSCRRRSCASGTRTLDSLPKPVLMP